MERVLRKTHIKRLNKGECSTQAGVNFIDIISHYTRVSDHAMNLAEKVIAEQIYHFEILNVRQRRRWRRARVQPAVSFLVCSLIFIEYKYQAILNGMAFYPPHQEWLFLTYKML